MILPDGSRLTGTYRFDGEQLLFTLADGTEILPTLDADGNASYACTLPNGYELRFTLEAGATAQLHRQLG